MKHIFDDIPIRYPELKGKTALVTGSSRGIGKGIALRLGREGMNVVITSRTAETVKATEDEFRSVGVNVASVVADLSTDKGLDAVFKATLDAFGTVDVLVNNAADLRRTALANMPEGLADYQLLANIRAPYECSVRASEIMKRDGAHGSIVNITSVGGLRAHFHGLPYDMTKGAMDSMTKSMALDLCEFGIRVNSIAPGATINKSLTDEGNDKLDLIGRIPLKRLGTPLDIGATTAFLCSSDAAYIIGQIIYVDGGITTMLGTPDQPV